MLNQPNKYRIPREIIALFSGPFNFLFGSLASTPIQQFLYSFEAEEESRKYCCVVEH
jgi:hypothetical protein